MFGNLFVVHFLLAKLKVLIIGRQFVGYIFFASFGAALLAKLEFLLVKVELKLKNFVLYLRHYIIMICLSIVN